MCDCFSSPKWPDVLRAHQHSDGQGCLGVHFYIQNVVYRYLIYTLDVTKLFIKCVSIYNAYIYLNWRSKITFCLLQGKKWSQQIHFRDKNVDRVKKWFNYFLISIKFKRSQLDPRWLRVQSGHEQLLIFVCVWERECVLLLCCNSCSLCGASCVTAVESCTTRPVRTALSVMAGTGLLFFLLKSSR